MFNVIGIPAHLIPLIEVPIAETASTEVKLTETPSTLGNTDGVVSVRVIPTEVKLTEVKSTLEQKDEVVSIGVVPTEISSTETSETVSGVFVPKIYADGSKSMVCQAMTATKGRQCSRFVRYGDKFCS